MVGITAYGAYIPRRRLQRKAVAEANAWFAPNLAGGAKGERAMANWDEDAVTMAFEAARDCLPASDPAKDRAHVDAITFASTTLPFADRLNAGIVAAALGLPKAITSLDVSSSLRCGTSAMIAVLDSVTSGRAASPLLVASDKRKARVASAQELAYGDAAAAFAFGGDKVIAEFLGAHTVTLDFVDHFRGEGEDFDYGWEERWIRDEGYSKIVPAAVKTLLEKTGTAPGDIAHLILPCPFAKLDQTLAKQCGIDPARVRDNLAGTVGDSGAAHALLMLSQVLETAKPGDKILVVQFAQGADVILFEVTPSIASLPKRSGVSGSLARRKEETNYLKYLGFNGLIELEKGMRAEVDKRTALTVLYRKGDMLTSLEGGKCRVCGTAQYPLSRICVNPNCKAVDSQDPYGFSESKGTVLSWSADFLTYALDPPNHYGMITFAEGGRLMADITDVEQGQIDTGAKVRMAFRIKDFDPKRGFIRYFWKAVPV
ncbi:MAG: hydroxymethylglutaryl-CoA synthase family protein [Proteobacteria bacterium]|nr:hydroxymethylglutaryl-CoA synthase family protein [Pseudomonadota bacterium]